MNIAMKTIAALAFATSLPVWSQALINPTPSREFGQAHLDIPLKSIGANLVAGREFFSPVGIAMDTSVNPPILYVFDTNNHRVLAFRNPESYTTGATADKVIGQRDLYGTLPQGPAGGNGVSAGFTFPIGGTVDSNGNLYVIDAGNNRIVRFPHPLDQQGSLLQPDLWIGQKVISAGSSANQGNANPSAKTLAFSQGATPLKAGIAFDPSGNLWVADAGNHRVIRFPSSQLTAFKVEPEADLVIGQINLSSGALPASQNRTQTNGTVVVQPLAVAFDTNGGMYVADSLSRVMYYASPGAASTATRILGVQPTPVQGQTALTRPSQYSLGGNNGSNPPNCVFTQGTVVYVCDPGYHRIVRYDSPSNWAPASDTNPSPAQAQVYGQSGFTTGDVNRGQTRAMANSFSAPSDGRILNGEMWVADTGNNRVLSFASNTFNFDSASRVFGQDDFIFSGRNLVEGGGLFLNAGNTARGAGLVVDTTSTPNHLYVSDYLNHRVLGFRDSRAVGVDARTLLTMQPDLIIGQPEAHYSDVNYPNADPDIPSDQGLFSPAGIDVDADGNLWVADSGNGRVLRFPKPFDQEILFAPHADLVIGQSAFNFKIQDASDATMVQPMGVAVFNNGGLAVSDAALNRVLIFRKNGTFMNGQRADVVLGQPNFFSSATGSGSTGFNSPHEIDVDTSDRLYIADTNNNRVAIYGATSSSSPTFSRDLTASLSRPESVAVSSLTGRIWVASTNNNRVYQYLEFTQLAVSDAPVQTLAPYIPLGVAIDGFDNLIMAEGSNRLLFFFPAFYSRSAANYTISGLSPGQMALLARFGKDFNLASDVATAIPLPKQLSGLEVLVNGTPAAIFRVDPQVIYFIVPWNAPVTGSAEYVVQRPETGEILAAGNINGLPASPGFFTSAQNGGGPVAATNKDGTVNSATNPASQVDYITFWLTGQGLVDHVPDDGAAPPSGTLARTTGPLQVYINWRRHAFDSSQILFSGLSPDYPGLWQLTIQLNKDMHLPITTESIQQPVPMLLIMSGHQSNQLGTNGQNGPGNDIKITGTDPRLTVFYVKE